MLLFGLSAAFAQAPDPTLDEDDRLALVMLATFSTRAKSDCDALDSAKTYQAMRQRVEARLKVKHGLTVDQAITELTKAPTK